MAELGDVSTVVKLDGSIIIPEFRSQPFGSGSSHWYELLGDGHIIIHQTKKPDLLFGNSKLLKEADEIQQVFRHNYDLWYIKDGAKNGFVNLNTDWKIFTKYKITSGFNVLSFNTYYNDTFLVSSKLVNEKNSANETFKIFRLEKDNVRDVTPLKDEIVYVVYILPFDKNTVDFKYLFFTKGDDYGKIATFYKDSSLPATVEETIIDLPKKHELRLSVWEVNNNEYNIVAYKPGSFNNYEVNISYFSDTKIIVDETLEKNETNDRDYKERTIGLFSYDSGNYDYYKINTSK